eukprot:6389305-Prymnesium_polylepis.1
MDSNVVHRIHDDERSERHAKHCEPAEDELPGRVDCAQCLHKHRRVLKPAKTDHQKSDDSERQAYPDDQVVDESARRSRHDQQAEGVADLQGLVDE